MTRTALEIEILIIRREADLKDLARTAARIDREIYRIPNYTMAYNRRIADLEHIRAEMDGIQDRIARLNGELNEVLNPQFA
jgi:hypothetical protein